MTRKISKKISRVLVESTFEDAISGLQVTDDYRARISEIAGPIGMQVGVVFKGRSDIAYLLCDQTRRQVWNCALSNLNVILEWEKDPDFSEKFFQDLCQMKSSDIIERTFGSNPPGFIKALTQFGDIAQSAETYKNLHALLSADPSFSRHLNRDKPLLPKTLACLVSLPVGLREPDLAHLIVDHHHEAAFLEFVTAAEALPDHERDDVYRQLRRASPSYEAFKNQLFRLCSQFPFPPPKLRDPKKVRHLANEIELKLAGDYFGNCLSTMAEQAHRGDLQFYEWLGLEQGVFSIREQSGEWIIDELDFLEGTEERHWDMVREFVRANLGYPVVRPKKSLLEATRALLRAANWSSDENLFD